MPNGNWVPLPPFAQQFLTHLLMNKRISSYSLKNLNWPESKGKLFDGCELEARVSEKNEEIHHRTNFIFGTSWNEKTWDNNMLNLIQVLLCWEISKNGWNYNFWVILLLCSRNKEFSSIAYRVYWWGYRSHWTAVLLYQQVLTLLSALLLAIICFFFFSVL